MTDAETDRFAGRIYYADQSAWNQPDWHALYVYLHRLILFVGPTPGMLENPEHRASRIQANRNGQQDEELSALDPSRMSTKTRYLLKHMLISQKRYELALERFPNLRSLESTETPDLPILIKDRTPAHSKYLREHGIIY